MQLFYRDTINRMGEILPISNYMNSNELLINALEATIELNQVKLAGELPKKEEADVIANLKRLMCYFDKHKDRKEVCLYKQELTGLIKEKIKDLKQFTKEYTAEDFVCPISLCYFFEPRMVKPCLHIFEDLALQKWLKTKKEEGLLRQAEVQKQDKDGKGPPCPCCKREITGITSPPSSFISSWKNYLTNNPELLKKNNPLGTSYFNIKILDSYSELPPFKKKWFTARLKEEINAVVLKRNKDGGEDVRPIVYKVLERLIKPNISSAKLANGIQDEAKLAELPKNNKNLAYQDKQELFNFLQSAEIDEAMLNMVVEKYSSNKKLLVKNSAFNLIAENEISLLDEASLRAKISTDTLNALTINNKGRKGGAMLFYLCKAEPKKQYLAKDSKLRAKISEQGLNTWGTTHDEMLNISPLYLLTSFVKGIELLDDGEDGETGLWRNITKEGLNHVVTHLGYRSPLYWLAKYPEGRRLLLKHKELRDQIDEVTLSTIVIEDNKKQGKSAAQLLLESNECDEFFAITDESFKEKLINISQGIKVNI